MQSASKVRPGASVPVSPVYVAAGASSRGLGGNLFVTLSSTSVYQTSARGRAQPGSLSITDKLRKSLVLTELILRPQGVEICNLNIS